MSYERNTECLVACKNCGTVTVAEWRDGLGILGIGAKWKVRDPRGNCLVCHNFIDLSKLKVAVCPHCGKAVEQTEDDKCINCHRSLHPTAPSAQVPCPICGIMVAIPEDRSESCSCKICGALLTTEYINARLAEGAVETEQYIRLPDEASMRKKDRAIWKHPMNTFPFKSRMQVNEGTYALFLQNGVCMEPCDPGSYLLEDSDLERSQRLTEALHDDSIVFQTDLFCVLKDLGEFSWGSVTEIIPSVDLSTDTFRNAEQTASYTAGCSGRIALWVCDAKAFARFAGFHENALSELLKVSPQPGTTDGPLIRLTREQVTDALYACLNGLKEEHLQRLSATDIKEQLTMELNRRLAGYGLCASSLQINNLYVKKSEQSRQTDEIRSFVQSEFSWIVPNVQLSPYGKAEQYAQLSFSGTCRAKINNESAFWNMSEVRKLSDDSVNRSTILDFVRDKTETLLKNTIPTIAKDKLYRGEIPDLLDPLSYVPVLSNQVQEQLNYSLASYGLAVAGFWMNIPSVTARSQALVNAVELPARKRTVIHAIESGITLSTLPVRVHLRDDKSVYADVQFSGTCHLRVRDEDAFCRLSETERFLTDSAPVSEMAVVRLFTDKINPLFEEILSRITQSVVDQTNADIRELNRFTGILKDSVRAGLTERVERWGLFVEALDLAVPKMVGSSSNLGKMADLEEVRSGAKLEEEIRKIRTDSLISEMAQENHLNDAAMESADHRDATQHEMNHRKADRVQDEKIDSMQKTAQINELSDKLSEEAQQRRSQAALDAFRRQSELQEAQLMQKIREDNIRQEAVIKTKHVDQQAVFDRELADAEHQRAISEITHRIAESDLTWQQKVDEYNRLRKKVAFEDTQEADRLKADTDLYIRRGKDQADYDKAVSDLAVEEKAADLSEKVSRNTEDRKERTLEADFKRQERAAILTFEQQLKDRREHVAQQIELLNVQYDHALNMRSKDLELDKLKEEVKLAMHTATQDADVKKTQAKADADAKIAQAQAAVKQLEEQLKKEEAIAQRAEEFRKALLEIQAALELTRLGNEKNRDNRLADVATAQAQAQTQAAAAARGQEGRRADAMEQRNNERLNELDKKLDRVINSVKNLRVQVNELKKWLPPYYTGYPAGGYPQPGTYNPSYSPDKGNYPGSPYPQFPPSGIGSPQPGVAVASPAGRCPTCGAPVEEGWKYCPKCSNPLL